MDEGKINLAVGEELLRRLNNTPNDYYIDDTGRILYALLAGEYVWSMIVPDGENFHAMQPSKIALLIHEELSKKLG